MGQSRKGGARFKGWDRAERIGQSGKAGTG